MDRTDPTELWNANAEDWHLQVGREGDLNRRLNSDPVLWSFLGDVGGLAVLDAGCGTGYLSRKLAAAGARVIAIDAAERMIAVARRETEAGLDVTYRVESCSELGSVDDQSVDRIVSNYVLMDVSDLMGTLRAFHRVLKPGGIAVTIFSHPCFPLSQADEIDAEGAMSLRWTGSYFKDRRLDDPPWDHFTTGFVWFHRPLRQYWRAFRDAGFTIDDFDEPSPRAPFPEGVDEARVERSLMYPASAAFRLVREAAR